MRRSCGAAVQNVFLSGAVVQYTNMLMRCDKTGRLQDVLTLRAKCRWDRTYTKQASGTPSADKLHSAEPLSKIGCVYSQSSPVLCHATDINSLTCESENS